MKKIFGFILPLLFLFASCEENVEPVDEVVPGPELVSSTPADGATDISALGVTMKLTFDMSVMCPTAKRSLITIDNNAEIVSIEPYGEVITLRIEGLEKGCTYTLTFPKGCVIGYDENEAEEFSISFTTKALNGNSDINVTGLCNPNASKEARNVYQFLKEQSGSKTLSGVQSSHSHKNDFVDFIYQKTGKHPALAGYDFLFLQYSPTPDNWGWVQNYNDISAAKEQWEANGLVNYMWHWNVPDSKEDWDNGVNDYNFDGYSFYSDKTSFDIREALKEGTWQNDFIMKDIEEVAGYLQLLEDENIPVIWRPLHEAAGNYGIYSSGAWFWWGRHGAEPCKQLWRLLYDQLVNVYGLDNLIWVWTVDAAEGHEERNLEWYPGDEYVDIVGVDLYENNTDAKTRQYEALLEVTGGKKLVTISECGNIPDPQKCMEAENGWSWFMVWPSTDDKGNMILTPEGWNLNTLEYWQKVMDGPYTLNREDMPSLK